ncbi:MAG: hypothetical protein RBS81_10490 [Tenuifilaceae bacterium]|jgi:hypothetical protein|nr:hypothetical protein [Tenuifilaceae bacterium]
MARLYVSILLVFIANACSRNSIDTKQVAQFNEVFTGEKLEVINLGLESFDLFLQMNFGNISSERSRIIKFLEVLNDSIFLDQLKFPSQNRSETIIALYEKTGLRKDYFFYQFEDSVNEEMINANKCNMALQNEDSLIHFNTTGLYRKALENIKTPDSLVIYYTNTIDAVGLISTKTASQGLLYSIKNNNYNIEIAKRIILFEFYFELLKSNSKRPSAIKTKN